MRIPRWLIAAIALMLIASAALSYSAAMMESPTCDEPLHAAAGYAVRWMNDYRMDCEDPALFLLLSTIPQSSGDLHIFPGDPGFRSLLTGHFNQWQSVIEIMFRTPRGDGTFYSGVDYINRARIVFVCVAVILGAMIALWAYRLAGASAALIAAALFAFDPNFMAHGALVKNDVPMSLLMLCVMYAIWKLGTRITFARVLALAVACAIAINIKFSGVFCGAFIVCALLIRALNSEPWSAWKRTLTRRLPRLMCAIGICVFVCVFCWISTWAVYRFRFSMTHDPSLVFDRRIATVQLKALRLGNQWEKVPVSQIESMPLPLTPRVILWLDDHHVLPDAWLWGFFFTYSDLYRDSFLMGQHSLSGWWYYFPLAMLFKTAIAVLVCIAVLLCRAIVARDASPWINRFRRVPRWDMICLWVPTILYGCAAMMSTLNLGLRHVLPLYPFIYILIAVSIARWRGAAPRLATIFAILIVVGTAAETLARWPHEIAFFNVTAGGPRGGLKLLSDSNLDWGQDLPMLANWQQDHPDTPLYLAYFGSADPHVYGIDYINITGGYMFSDVPAMPMTRPGVFAISATFLQGTYNAELLADQLAYLKNKKPLAVLGGSIYLFDWNPAEFDAFKRALRAPTVRERSLIEEHAPYGPLRSRLVRSDYTEPSNPPARSPLIFPQQSTTFLADDD